MTEEQIADLVERIEMYVHHIGFADMPAPHSLLSGALELIRELQDRLAAEQADHNATIEHCEQVLARGSW